MMLETATGFFLCIHLKQTVLCTYTFALVSLSLYITSGLPCHQKEDATDSQVGQKHEEPDSRGEGIQKGEVAWSPTLEHTHT